MSTDVLPDPTVPPTSLVTGFDALTPEVMRARGSLKWTRYPGDVIGAWVAEMDLGTAPSVREAIVRAATQGTLGYMPPALPRELAQVLAGYERDAFGWDVDPDEVSLLPDVLSSLRAIIAHHTREGSAVIVPTPAYMPFLSIPGRLGRECVQVPALVGEDPDGRPRWELDLDRVETAMADGAGLLVLCNPWNPVGRVLVPEELDAVAALSGRYGVPVFSDEIHAPLVLDPDMVHVPYASRPGADPALTFTATAASKGWNVPGLKCAQLVASGAARQAWDACDASHHLAFEASILGARATVAAFRDGRGWLEEVCAYVRGNAGLVADALAEVPGARLTVPEGTYLAWLDCSGLGLERSPADFLRQEAHVAFNDGAAFGTGYEQFVRVNLATGHGIETETARRVVAALTGRL